MYSLENEILDEYNGSSFLKGHFVIFEDGSMWNAIFMHLPLVFPDPEDEDGYGINYFDRYLQRK